MPSPVHKQWSTGSVSRSLLMLLSGQLLTALSGLVYGKLTAIYVPPAVWGDYTLLVVGMTLLHGFLVAPTLQACKAALAQFSQQQVIAFYGRALGRIYLTIVLFVAFLAGLYYQNPIFGLVWLAAVGQGLYQFGSNYLNTLSQHRRFILLQTGYAVGTVLMFAFIVIVLNQRTVTGLWLALALVNTVLAAMAIWLLIRDNRLVGSSSMVADSTEIRRTCRQYVWPLLSLAFWGWLINYADRYLIRLYLTDADVGQYAMGYGLGSKQVLLVAPLLAFLSPQVLRLASTGQPPEMANQLIRHYLIRYVLLAGAGCLLFYTGRNWIGRLLLSDGYAPAFLVGPMVAVGYLFLTSIHLLELKWYAFGQTKFVLWHNLLGALLNISFNLVLIPRMGIVGAALAALLGLVGQFLLAIWLFLRPKSAD